MRPNQNLRKFSHDAFDHTLLIKSEIGLFAKDGIKENQKEWQLFQICNDRFTLKRVRDKHYLRAAADVLLHPKAASVHRVCADVCPGEIPFYHCPSLLQTVVVSVGSLEDISVCLNSGKHSTAVVTCMNILAGNLNMLDLKVYNE